MNKTGKNASDTKLLHINQILKFGAVGIINTGIDFGIFTILLMTTSLVPTACHVISYSAGVVNSYFFNRLWTFKVRERANSFEFVKFIIVNLVSLGVSTLVLYLLNDKASLDSLVSKLGGTLCSLFVNFIGSKLIVFNASKADMEEAKDE